MPAALKIFTSGATNVLPFGSVPKGTPVLLKLCIANNGDTGLIITDVSLTVNTGGASDFILSGFTPGSPVLIAPGDVNISLGISFNPSADFQTLEQATLTFVSNSASGTNVYTVTGICADAGSTNSAGGADESSNAIQGASGTSTVSSVGSTFAAYAIPSGARVSISFTFQSTITLTGGGVGTAKVQVSTDSGGSWQDAYGTSTGGTNTQNLSVPIANTATDFNQIQVRTTAVATVNVFGSSNVTASVSNLTLNATVGGDDSVQVSLNYIGLARTFACEDYGAVVKGGTYTSDDFQIYNYMLAPVTVNLTFNGTAGFSLDPGGIVGTQPIPPGGMVTFKMTLVPPKGGNQDIVNAFTLASGLSGYTVLGEALYEAPAIVSAFSLVGDVEKTVLAMQDGELEYFSMDPADELEDAAFFSKQLYLDQPQMNKQINRLWLLFERVAQSALLLDVATANPINVPAIFHKQLSLPNVTDGKLDIRVWDFQITGSVIEVTVTLEQGKASLVGFVFKVDENGEVIEGT